MAYHYLQDIQGTLLSSEKKLTDFHVDPPVSLPPLPTLESCCLLKNTRALPALSDKLSKALLRSFVNIPHQEQWNFTDIVSCAVKHSDFAEFRSSLGEPLWDKLKQTNPLPPLLVDCIDAIAVQHDVLSTDPCNTRLSDRIVDFVENAPKDWHSMPAQLLNALPPSCLSHTPLSRAVELIETDSGSFHLSYLLHVKPPSPYKSKFAPAAICSLANAVAKILHSPNQDETFTNYHFANDLGIAVPVPTFDGIDKQSSHETLTFKDPFFLIAWRVDIPQRNMLPLDCSIHTLFPWQRKKVLLRSKKKVADATMAAVVTTSHKPTISDFRLALQQFFLQHAEHISQDFYETCHFFVKNQTQSHSNTHTQLGQTQRWHDTDFIDPLYSELQTSSDDDSTRYREWVALHAEPTYLARFAVHSLRVSTLYSYVFPCLADTDSVRRVRILSTRPWEPRLLRGDSTSHIARQFLNIRDSNVELYNTASDKTTCMFISKRPPVTVHMLSIEFLT